MMPMDIWWADMILLLLFVYHPMYVCMYACMYVCMYVQQPIYVFAVDVSPPAIESGMMGASLDAIAEALEELPGGDQGM